LYELYALFKKEKVDVLHAHHVPMFRLCYWPAKMAGVKKMILTEHTEYDIKSNPRFKKMAISYGKKADLITVVHSGIKEYFVNELLLNANKIKVVFNGIDVERFRPINNDENQKLEFGLGDLNVVLGWIGRFHPDKDLKNLIQAFHISLEKNDKLILLLIGYGEELELIENLISELKITDKVIILGERKDIPVLINNMDMLIISSRTEGLPLVVLEAMSCGIPCVSTDVGGISEVITQDVGMVVEAQNSIKLSKSIIELANSKSTRKKMGQNARKKAVAYYSQENMFEEYYRLLTD